MLGCLVGSTCGQERLALKDQLLVELLTPEGWYERGHGIVGGGANADGVWLPIYRSGTMLVWVPPPGAASQATDTAGCCYI